MTRNPVGDSEAFSAVFWSAITNGIAQEAIVSGVDPSKGTGDFDVDTTSGEALVQGSPVSVSSATTTLSTSGTDDRVDLITVDSGGSVSATQGTPAADPIAPDIPSGEVLVAAVLVEGGASSLNSSGSKIADYRVIRDKRLQSTGTDTTLVNDAGNSAVVANDGSHHRFFAQSSTPIEFRDGVGGIPAGTYTPGASAPNTWDWGGHDFTNINSIDTDSADIDTLNSSPRPDLAQSYTALISNFEDKSDFTFSSSIDIKNDQARAGLSSLQMNKSGGGGIKKTSGLLPQTNDIHSVFSHPNSDTILDVRFGSNNLNTTETSGDGVGYGTRFRPSNSTLTIRRFDSNSTTQLASVTLSINADEWYEIRMQHTDTGDITISVFNSDYNKVVTASANDTTYISSGEYDNQEIGVFSARENHYVDLWRVIA